MFMKVDKIRDDELVLGDLPVELTVRGELSLMFLVCVQNVSIRCQLYSEGSYRVQ
jgi:hypothetical protein